MKVHLSETAVSRRQFIRAMGLASVSLATIMACAPGAPSAGSPGGVAKSGTASALDELVAAARREGKLSVVTTIGEGYRVALSTFEEAYPGITLDHTNLNSSQFTPRAVQEFQSGVHAYDVQANTFGPSTIPLIKEGVITPIRPVIDDPALTADATWQDGFEAGFVDDEKKWIYRAFVNRSQSLYINTDQVAEGEIKRIEDLLNPKWKGKIVSSDPRAVGAGWWPATVMRLALGDDTIIKRLYKDQDVLLLRNNRQSTEAMVRGTHAIGLGAVYDVVLQEFIAEGLAKNIKEIQLDNVNYVTDSSNLSLFSKAPNPNAAKLFIHWIMSKEGATAWSKASLTNSRRADVPAAYPDLAPTPGVKYLVTYQSSVDAVERTAELAKEALN
ncbi:MAG: ABC transporter substrate-binding protein [Chloroflexota bacterium]